MYLTRIGDEIEVKFLHHGFGQNEETLFDWDNSITAAETYRYPMTALSPKGLTAALINLHNLRKDCHVLCVQADNQDHYNKLKNLLPTVTSTKAKKEFPTYFFLVFEASKESPLILIYVKNQIYGFYINLSNEKLRVKSIGMFKAFIENNQREDNEARNDVTTTVCDADKEDASDKIDTEKSNNKCDSESINDRTKIAANVESSEVDDMDNNSSNKTDETNDIQALSLNDSMPAASRSCDEEPLIIVSAASNQTDHSYVKTPTNQCQEGTIAVCDIGVTNPTPSVEETTNNISLLEAMLRQKIPSAMVIEKEDTNNISATRSDLQALEQSQTLVENANKAQLSLEEQLAENECVEVPNKPESGKNKTKVTENKNDAPNKQSLSSVDNLASNLQPVSNEVEEITLDEPPPSVMIIENEEATNKPASGKNKTNVTNSINDAQNKQNDGTHQILSSLDNLVNDLPAVPNEIEEITIDEPPPSVMMIENDMTLPNPQISSAGQFNKNRGTQNTYSSGAHQTQNHVSSTFHNNRQAYPNIQNKSAQNQVPPLLSPSSHSTSKSTVGIIYAVPNQMQIQQLLVPQQTTSQQHQTQNHVSSTFHNNCQAYPNIENKSAQNQVPPLSSPSSHSTSKSTVGIIYAVPNQMQIQQLLVPQQTTSQQHQTQNHVSSSLHSSHQAYSNIQNTTANNQLLLGTLPPYYTASKSTVGLTQPVANPMQVQQKSDQPQTTSQHQQTSGNVPQTNRYIVIDSTTHSKAIVKIEEIKYIIKRTLLKDNTNQTRISQQNSSTINQNINRPHLNNHNQLNHTSNLQEYNTQLHPARPQQHIYQQRSMIPLNIANKLPRAPLPQQHINQVHPRMPQQHNQVHPRMPQHNSSSKHLTLNNQTEPHRNIISKYKKNAPHNQQNIEKTPSPLQQQISLHQIETSPQRQQQVTGPSVQIISQQSQGSIMQNSPNSVACEVQQISLHQIETRPQIQQPISLHQIETSPQRQQQVAGPSLLISQQSQGSIMQNSPNNVPHEVQQPKNNNVIQKPDYVTIPQIQNLPTNNAKIGDIQLKVLTSQVQQNQENQERNSHPLAALINSALQTIRPCGNSTQPMFNLLLDLEKNILPALFKSPSADKIQKVLLVEEFDTLELLATQFKYLYKCITHNNCKTESTVVIINVIYFLRCDKYRSIKPFVIEELMEENCVPAQDEHKAKVCLTAFKHFFKKMEPLWYSQIISTVYLFCNKIGTETFVSNTQFVFKTGNGLVRGSQAVAKLNLTLPFLRNNIYQEKVRLEELSCAFKRRITLKKKKLEVANINWESVKIFKEFIQFTTATCSVVARKLFNELFTQVLSVAEFTKLFPWKNKETLIDMMSVHYQHYKAAVKQSPGGPAMDFFCKKNAEVLLLDLVQNEYIKDKESLEVLERVLKGMVPPTAFSGVYIDDASKKEFFHARIKDLVCAIKSNKLAESKIKQCLGKLFLDKEGTVQNEPLELEQSETTDITQQDCNKENIDTANDNQTQTTETEHGRNKENVDSNCKLTEEASEVSVSQDEIDDENSINTNDDTIEKAVLPTVTIYVKDEEMYANNGDIKDDIVMSEEQSLSPEQHGLSNQQTVPEINEDIVTRKVISKQTIHLHGRKFKILFMEIASAENQHNFPIEVLLCIDNEIIKTNSLEDIGEISFKKLDKDFYKIGLKQNEELDWVEEQIPFIDDDLMVSLVVKHGQSILTTKAAITTVLDNEINDTPEHNDTTNDDDTENHVTNDDHEGRPFCEIVLEKISSCDDSSGECSSDDDDPFDLIQSPEQFSPSFGDDNYSDISSESDIDVSQPLVRKRPFHEIMNSQSKETPENNRSSNNKTDSGCSTCKVEKRKSVDNSSNTANLKKKKIEVGGSIWSLDTHLLFGASNKLFLPSSVSLKQLNPSIIEQLSNPQEVS